MAYFAELDENNIVLRVIAVSDKDEADGENFCNRLLGGRWKQTSYNTRGNVHYDPVTNLPDDKPAFRKNYAGIGYSYNEQLDAFIPPKPYFSWSLNQTTGLWEPPVPYPNDTNNYIWNESLGEWSLVE